MYRGEAEIKLQPPSNLGTRRGGWSAPRPGRFTPGKDPVPNVPVAELASGPLWTGTENLGPTGIRSPDRPASSGSPYRLRYHGRLVLKSAAYTLNKQVRMVDKGLSPCL